MVVCAAVMPLATVKVCPGGTAGWVRGRTGRYGARAPVTKGAAACMMRLEADLITAFQAEPVAGLVRGGDGQTEVFDNVADAADLLGV